MLEEADWTRSPEIDFASLYPAQARAAKVATGRGLVDCTVGTDGGLTACTVVEEQPAGLGFGKAALTMASGMALNRWGRDGASTVGARVRAPIRIDDVQEHEAAVIPATQVAPGSTPSWVRLPTADEFAGAFPYRASRAGVSGAAVMICNFTSDGFLRDCRIASETPEGYGFGLAALSMAAKFRLNIPKRDGKSADEGTITVPVRFNIGG